MIKRFSSDRVIIAVMVIMGLALALAISMFTGGSTNQFGRAKETEPKPVVEAFIHALQSNQPEKTVPYWVGEKRIVFDEMSRFEPVKFKELMELLAESEVDPFTGITIQDPVIEGFNATVRIENDVSNTTFFLEEEDTGWKIINFGIGQKTTGTFESE